MGPFYVEWVWLTGHILCYSQQGYIRKAHIEWSSLYGSFLCGVGVAKGVSLLSLKLMVHKKAPYRAVIFIMGLSYVEWAGQHIRKTHNRQWVSLHKKDP